MNAHTRNEIAMVDKKSSSTSAGFSADERAAMKERAKELKAKKNRDESTQSVLDAIAAMPDSDRFIATRIHELVSANAPDLVAKTWYGMPAYARDGKVVCFFQSAAKFDTRYATFGFNDSAHLDDGHVWPVAFAIATLTDSDEQAIAARIKQAIS
ncbi:MAG: iron chaperone [Microbacteriaceae bacterium]